eukprot:scaffold92575_cov17-Tisochrysis_lutea.AAC.1
MCAERECTCADTHGHTVMYRSIKPLPPHKPPTCDRAEVLEHWARREHEELGFGPHCGLTQYCRPEEACCSCSEQHAHRFGWQRPLALAAHGGAHGMQ